MGGRWAGPVCLASPFSGRPDLRSTEKRAVRSITPMPAAEWYSLGRGVPQAEARLSWDFSRTLSDVPRQTSGGRGAAES